jgi:hypothetical protein
MKKITSFSDIKSSHYSILWATKIHKHTNSRESVTMLIKTVHDGITQEVSDMKYNGHT